MFHLAQAYSLCRHQTQHSISLIESIKAHIHAYTHIHAYKHTHTFTHIHAYKHTHTFTHIHTYTQVQGANKTLLET
jgi:hypothetical protein